MTSNAVKVEDVSEGMFPTESVVSIKDHTGHLHYFIVDKSFLRGENRASSVRVSVLGRDSGVAVVLPPGEALSDASLVAVAESQLVPA